MEYLNNKRKNKMIKVKNSLLVFKRDLTKLKD